MKIIKSSVFIELLRNLLLSLLFTGIFDIFLNQINLYLFRAFPKSSISILQNYWELPHLLFRFYIVAMIQNDPVCALINLILLRVIRRQAQQTRRNLHQCQHEKKKQILCSDYTDAKSNFHCAASYCCLNTAMDTD